MSSAFLLKNLPSPRTLESLAARYPGFQIDRIETFLTLLRVAGGFLEATDAYLAKHRTSQGRLRVLLQLVQSPKLALSPCEIAERLGISRATTTGLLDGLERGGFVRRESIPRDRRSIRVRLLHKGEKLLDSMMPGRFRQITGWMERLTKRERAELRRILQKLAPHPEAPTMGNRHE